MKAKDVAKELLKYPEYEVLIHAGEDDGVGYSYGKPKICKAFLDVYGDDAYMDGPHQLEDSAILPSDYTSKSVDAWVII